MQALARRYTTDRGWWGHREIGAKRDGGRCGGLDKVMRADRRRDGALRPGGTDWDDAMRCIVAPAVWHRAVMLAVAAAAGRQTGVRILRKREQGRRYWKREGREQQEGEQAAHGKPDGSSVRLAWRGRTPVFMCGDSVE